MSSRPWMSRPQRAAAHSTRDGADLRRRLGAILAAEEADPPEWARVARLSDELQRQLLADRRTRCPGVVSHYIDEADIRISNEGFAKRQRNKVRRFVTTGRCPTGPLASSRMFAVALLLAAVMMFSILW